MKPLPPEVSLGQLLDIMAGKKPKPVPRPVVHGPLNKWWRLKPVAHVRHFSGLDLEEDLRKWREDQPKANTDFLRMFAELERKREQQRKIDARRTLKAKGRERYLKRIRARATRCQSF